jgi:hypothetical protein
MLLILQIAAGVLLGLSLWRLPAFLRRRKLTGIFSRLSDTDAMWEATRNDVYTEEQRGLFIQLALTKDRANRKSLISQLVNSFPDK